MAYDRFMIAPFETGLETDVKPWMITDDAMAELKNAYVWRGRIRKRFGGVYSGYGATTPQMEALFSRLKTNVIASYAVPGGSGVGIINGGGAATATLASPPFVASTLGDKFEVGTQWFTVTSLSAVPGAPVTMTTAGAGTGTIITHGAGAGTFAFAGCTPGAQVYYFQINNYATTDGSGYSRGLVPGTIFKIGQLFSIGDEIFTVKTTSGPYDMLTTGSATTHTFNTTTGVYEINGADDATDVYFYPSEPVMGITQYETGPVNNQPTYAFDTQFAYIYAGGSWLRVKTNLVPKFTSSDSDFFWTCNWRGALPQDVVLFVTNFKSSEMSYYNGTAWTQPWTPSTVPGGANQILTAKIIVPFKDRLVLLNTIETGNVAHVNRCRFSHNGSPLATSAFYIPNSAGFTGGGYIDCPTKESIISAQFLKDRLIVYFEESTWELAYTGNQILPFVWQKLNRELGSQSTFSSVPFDKAILTIGKTGIHACNGVNVERCDQKIPQKLFEVRNSNEGSVRIAGIRDYYTETVYWTLPLSKETYANKYPNSVLVYNYATGSWAINDDCITAFGYFEQQLDMTWSQAHMTWEQANFTWSSGIIQQQFRQIFAGNQQGFVFIVSPDVGRNASVMSIVKMVQVGLYPQLTIVNHNLKNYDAIYIENCLGSTTLNNKIYQVSVVDADTIQLLSAPPITGTYTGGGFVARVSQLSIKTKQFNPYAKKGKNVFISKIDFYVDRTTSGEVTVEYYPSSTTATTLGGAYWTGALLGDGVLSTAPYSIIPQEALQDRLWHPIYFQVDGDGIQLYFYYDEDSQLKIPSIAFSDLQIHAMVLYTMPISRLQ